MIVSESKLNEYYKRYCKNKKVDILNEENTKEFMLQWMAKRKLTRVRKEGNNYHFI